jgi:hypothetical protein
VLFSFLIFEVSTAFTRHHDNDRLDTWRNVTQIALAFLILFVKFKWGFFCRNGTLSVVVVAVDARWWCCGCVVGASLFLFEHTQVGHFSHITTFPGVPSRIRPYSSPYSIRMVTWWCSCLEAATRSCAKFSRLFNSSKLVMTVRNYCSDLAHKYHH